jgi:aldehyde:ferredoxin oxidoreductase
LANWLLVVRGNCPGDGVADGCSVPDTVAHPFGKSILKTEYGFNLAAGFTSKDDRLSEFFEALIPPHNAVWVMSVAEIDTFRNF